MRFSFLSAALAGFLSLSTTVHAASLITDVSVNAPDAAGLQPTIDAFRTALGANNGNNPVNADPNGRRQINWDAAPDFISDPNAFPGDFFNANVNPRARGIEFKATGKTTGFQLSSTAASGEPVGFGFPNDFKPFSPERLFTPIGGTTLDVLFFDPATQTNAATTRGLGVIFSDVELAKATTLSLFDAQGSLLAKRSAKPGKSGSLSFLGLIFDDPVIAKASINVGTAALVADGYGGYSYGYGDGVVMDDFIFGEPVPIAAVPLPAGLALLGSALAGLGAARLRRRKTA